MSSTEYTGIILSGATTYHRWSVDAANYLVGHGVTCVLADVTNASAQAQALAQARSRLLATMDSLSALQFLRASATPRQFETLDGFGERG